MQARLSLEASPSIGLALTLRHLLKVTHRPPPVLEGATPADGPSRVSAGASRV